MTVVERSSRGLVQGLVRWFSENARDLPWRRTRDPYLVFVSEIMLQQTQVKTVIPYYERWVLALPDVRSVAEAAPEKLHKLWEGLGYYTRVRNLQKAAQQVVEKHGGKFPRKFEEVLALPGVGRYTAGAICSIAYGQPTPILDGNVARVLARVYGVAGSPREKRVLEQLWERAQELVQGAAKLRVKETGAAEAGGWRPPGAPCSLLNQSLMELGALICTPAKPTCRQCPVRTRCTAWRAGRVDQIPARIERPASIARRFAAFVVERRGRFLVRQRPEGVVNGGLWEFPTVELSGNANIALEAAGLGVVPQSLEPCLTVRHSITRYRMRLEAYRCGLLGGKAPRLKGSEHGNQRWATRAQLRDLAFPSAHRRVVQAVLGCGQK